MSKDKEIPVIEQSLLVTYQDTCNGCDSHEDLKFFTFRTGRNATFVLAWCKACRAKIAACLLEVDQPRKQAVSGR